MSDYQRPLYNMEVAEDFVMKVLGIPKDAPNFYDIVVDIVKQERYPMFAQDTVANQNIRDEYYRDENDRNTLRAQIFKEMITFKRLNDDEHVRLGLGGAMPNSKVVSSRRKAFYVMGLPASGKSSICGKLCDMFGAYLLDSDLVKRKLPEFFGVSGASIVHKESSVITMGGNFNGVKFHSLMEECFLNGYNICFAKIGSNLSDIIRLFRILRDCGYNIYVILVTLDRLDATRRAFKRFQRTQRYVSLSMIFDGYANDPILCYYRLRRYVEQKGHKYVDELLAISTNVPHGQPPKIEDQSYAGPILEQYLQTI